MKKLFDAAKRFLKVLWSAILSCIGQIFVFIAVQFIVSMGWFGLIFVIAFFILLVLFHAIPNINYPEKSIFDWGEAAIASLFVSAILTGICYIIAIGAPWLMTGIAKWWDWLGTHF
jgi:hypothetical protein